MNNTAEHVQGREQHEEVIKAAAEFEDVQAAAEDVTLMDFLKDPDFASESKRLTDMVHKARVEGGQKEFDLYSKMLS